LHITTLTVGSFTQCQREKWKPAVSILSTRLVTNCSPLRSLTGVNWH